jgi:predicted SnoaL-like aldol condensation-catalyzing enzyme
MRIQAGFLFFILLLLASCAQVDQIAATNEAVGDQFTNEGWNAGNLDALDAVVSKDFVRHNPPSADPPVVVGLEALKKYIADVRETYPDFHVEIHTRLAQGDLGAANWTATGTDAENGRAVKVPGISISRYLDGKLVEEWASWDTESLTDQQEAGSDTDGD